MKLTKLQIKVPRPAWILGLLFAVLLLGEVYLVYTKLYSSLAVEARPVGTNNIVRLDLAAYNKTVQMLDALKVFLVDNTNLPNINPFK